MHFHGKSSDVALATPHTYDKHSQGYTHASLIDHTTGSVHTGLSLNEIAPSGAISPHLHSYEKGFYILEGNVELIAGERSWQLGPGDFGALKVGTLHALRNSGQRPVRWLQMAAPQPKPVGKERDTFFLREGKPFAGTGEGVLLGHFDVSQIPEPGPARDALPVAKGVFLQWMIDEKLGARHHRMLFIEYLPGVKIALHDHTFEEAYFILSGEVEAVLDGERYLGKPGDVFWTSTGCVHTFVNVSNEPVRWLETFSPQPPAENVFRFMPEWEQRAKELEE